MTSQYRRLLRERAATDDAAFAEYMRDLVFPAHLREFSRFANTHERALILAPRGFAKTTLLIYRAARLIGLYRGTLRLGILTAVDDDAEARSRAIRLMIESPRFAEIFPWAAGGVEGPCWRDDAWTVRGANLGKDSTCLALSLGSARAGPRLDVLFADDPVGAQENATGPGRAKALETYLEVIDPMVVPGGVRLFVGTRWHEHDLYASLMQAGWAHRVRRAIEDGVPLWLQHFPLAELEARRLVMGSPLFNLQFMNDPAGMGGNIFRREWFRYVDDLPPGLRRVGVDLNASSSARADYSAVIEWLEDAQHNLYFVGAWRKRLDGGHVRWLTGRLDSLERGSIPSYGESDGPRLLWPCNLLPPALSGTGGDPSAPRRLTRVCIEATTFDTLIVRDLLAHTNLPAGAVRPDRDKVTRALSLAARMEAGKVFFLRGAAGPADFEDELAAFPNGEHDDQVDAAVYGAYLDAPPLGAGGLPRVWLISTSRGGAHTVGRHRLTIGDPSEPIVPPSLYQGRTRRLG
ncbi:MAG: phage terminase large subunit [Candidatus Limnocylindrales bacterium]|jgi:hypothetical protein